MADEQLDRRDMLMAAMEAAEEGTLEAPIEKEIEVVEDDIAKESLEAKAGDADREEPAEVSEEPELEATHEEAEEAAEEVKPVTRPSTWKKEYVQIWDKMEAGEQISKEDFVKFAEYANQRESEYKKGVSTYKAEADRARSYEEAIAPFIPELQAQNISPNDLAKAIGSELKKLPINSIQLNENGFEKWVLENGNSQKVFNKNTNW